MKITTLLTMMVTFGACGLVHADDAQDAIQLHMLRVTAPDKAAYGRLFQFGLDLPEAVPGAEVTVIGTEAEKTWLEAQGYIVEYELPQATRFFSTRARAAGAASMGGFRTLSEGEAAIDSIISGFPEIVSAKQTIALTLEGRPVHAIRISDHPNSDEPLEPAVLFTGLHHAREPMGPHILIHTMQQLTQGYGTDTLITRLVNERELWFIPFVNPDGYVYNESIAPEGGGLWRKNRRNNGDGSYGVDLNRNYGFQWGYDDAGSSPDPSSTTYRGAAAFSEIETQSVRDFCLARPNIRITLNYHSYSNLFLYPWGFERTYTPDHLLFAAIADSATTFNDYLPIPGWALYLTNGDADDWMYGDLGILSFTPEVGNSVDYFWPDPGRIDPLTDENYPVNLFIIDIADAPERLLPPAPPAWDSIALVGEDSIGFWWQNTDTSVNAPVSYDLVKLFGSDVIMDDFEAGDGYWHLAGFEHTGFETYTGTGALWSQTGSNLATTATTSEPYTVAYGDTLRFWVNYDIELDYDYGYVEVSTDGGQFFTPIPGNLTTMENPYGNNLGDGITGISDGWVVAWFDLSAFDGQEILIRFSYRTDGFVNGSGLYIDNVSPVRIFDSLSTVATVEGTSHLLADCPPGEYYFRLEATDAQGQAALSSTRRFEYANPIDYTVGDVNESGSITSGDIVYLVNHIFKGGPAPLPVWEAGDVDGSASLSSGDIIYLVNYLFKSGPPPVQP